MTHFILGPLVAIAMYFTVFMCRTIYWLLRESIERKILGSVQLKTQNSEIESLKTRLKVAEAGCSHLDERLLRLEYKAAPCG